MTTDGLPHFTWMSFGSLALATAPRQALSVGTSLQQRTERPRVAARSENWALGGGTVADPMFPYLCISWL